MPFAWPLQLQRPLPPAGAPRPAPSSCPPLSRSRNPILHRGGAEKLSRDHSVDKSRVRCQVPSPLHCAGLLVAIGNALIPMISIVPVNTFILSPMGSPLKIVCSTIGSCRTTSGRFLRVACPPVQKEQESSVREIFSDPRRAPAARELACGAITHAWSALCSWRAPSGWAGRRLGHLSLAICSLRTAALPGGRTLPTAAMPARHLCCAL